MINEGEVYRNPGFQDMIIKDKDVPVNTTDAASEFDLAFEISDGIFHFNTSMTAAGAGFDTAPLRFNPDHTKIRMSAPLAYIRDALAGLVFTPQSATFHGVVLLTVETAKTNTTLATACSSGIVVNAVNSPPLLDWSGSRQVYGMNRRALGVPIPGLGFSDVGFAQEAKNRPNIDWQDKIHRGILRESHEIFLRPRKTRV
jgi:hypothetical protein